MKKILVSLSILSFLFCLYGNYGQAKTNEPGTIYDYSKIVSKITRLHEDTNKIAPKNFFDRADNQFNANEYFNVLQHLSLNSDYLLDYVVLGQNGPFLYLRKSSEKQLKNYADCKEKFGGNSWRELKNSYLGAIKLDGSPESFFELIVLKELGGQFYLFWHANYFDTKIVASENDIENILRDNPLTNDQIQEAKK